ncbi:endopeptidase La [Alkalilimnicola ehrlichii]|uniref:Lon protease n=1 Tax=Alkalilimnicola ehrlichii TaxID=351052 RepID=A0A3E0WYI7_9GAMM|nr:endopeptidase La [Alkalilimnicola ehrlichii]RFA30515.1 endopeptidase La [Alkalilimnicola ehrlichii]RFA38064.1 endopeptidase La [Alkalilimnicola ehrlichii]
MANDKGHPEANDIHATVAALPEDALIIVPVRGTVLFPGLILPLALGRGPSIAAAQEAARNERPIGVLMQREAEMEAPGAEHMHEVGCSAAILRYVTAPDGTHHLICQGEQRFRVREFLDGYPFMVARIESLPEEASEESSGIQARLHHLKQRAHESLQLLPQAPPELVGAIENIRSAAQLADLVAGFMDISPEQKQEVLATLNLQDRLDRVLELLSQRLEVMRLSKEISERTQESVDERQREYLLREQLRTIQQELGEADGKQVEIEELSQAIAKLEMPREVEDEARKELKRLERMPEASSEYSMSRNYLDWLLALPWARLSEESIDIARAREVLDEDHYGLDKIKRRIVEYLAVRKLNPQGRSPILCFVGPPGVGKTSLGRSIARAMGLEFVRASLGGVHDEAEIRGHRRTYIGALPGNIVQGLRKVGTRNPVFMLDEMDKLGAGIQGDPSAALLEVLDPEQNNSFRDNYLGVPFDLSRVVFIATANVLDAIPGPLRDRMEVIELTGYTEDEKVQIARRYLVQRQLEANGLQPEQCRFSDEALHSIVRDYTREAGARNLEREIGAVCRNVAVRIAEGAIASADIAPADVREILGAPRYENEVAMRTSVPGVATGLAWTPVGGDILFIEASRAPGNGRLILTGQLGDVMKESAQAALSLIKARADTLGMSHDVLKDSDIHIHVPAGAIPKDGPSAGVAMFTALSSLFTERKVRSDTAMTGEISLRGLVLPVGGIKEKVVAAARAGVRTVMLPARNKRDWEDIPAAAREHLRFVWLETIDDALAEVLEPET